MLLRAGASVGRPDLRGYSPAHVAAQYGHTALLFHLAVRYGADMDSLDHDGRSPLHWAAYKGFPDPVRLLLFLDGRVNAPDREGCTPLHWRVGAAAGLHHSSLLSSLAPARPHWDSRPLGPCGNTTHNSTSSFLPLFLFPHAAGPP